MSTATKVRRPLVVLISALAMLGLGASSASAQPIWEIQGYHETASFQPGGKGTYTFIVNNVGDEPAVQDTDTSEGAPGLEDPVTMQIELPPDVTTRMQVVSAHFPPFLNGGRTWHASFVDAGWDCGASVAGQSSVTCTAILDPITPGARGLRNGRVTVYVDITPDATGPLTATATVSGGGGEEVAITETAQVGPPETVFGILPESLEADVFDEAGKPDRRAGGHPTRAIGDFAFYSYQREEKHTFGGSDPTVWTARPIENVRHIVAKLPRGFVGNPRATEECAWADFNTPSHDFTECPPSTQVGTLKVMVQAIPGPSHPLTYLVTPVYNLDPPKGVLASFGISILGRRVLIYPELDPTDYSVVTRVPNINSQLPLHFQRLTLWGNPSDPRHDMERWNPETASWGADSEAEPRPFLSLPTECNVPGATEFLHVASWDHTEVNAGPYSSAPAEVTGCDKLEFDPTIEAKPTTNIADAPTGLEFEMRIPQNEDPSGLATAHLRDAVVKLPEGMTVNPPSADGLQACSMAQVGIGANGVPSSVPHTNATHADGGLAPTPANCPEASKLGTVEAITPALKKPIPGAVYLAEQNDNPFKSLLALYLVLEDKERNVLVKLPGKVDADPVTGQLTATFRNNPQLPVEELRLKFFEGSRAALKTPATCGTYSTEAMLTPWSAPEAPSASESSSFTLTQGPGGGACLPGGGTAPNKPSFNAGTLDPTAKAFTPFVMKLSRADGTQQLKAIDTTLPKGLLGKLAGTTYCADAALASAATKSGKAERASASCPASSHVGSVNVGAGAGSTPLYVGGQAYLAGPYKGAPLSLAIITPALAGPFDLGTVVVRTALNVNPESAQIRAVSDELPTILQGIPLNIRSIALRMDRPRFTLNPTSCDPTSITGSALTVFGQSALLTNPFQVGECNRLGFKPKLAIRLKGGTKRSQYPALTATLKARPGDANIGKTIVALPHSEFLAQNHIRTICTRVQYAADACPAKSVYGYAKAWSPLLDQPLEGPVYLRSSTNKLPDLVAALDGQIDVDLVGRIDSVKGGIRTSFESVPDAPVSKFVLSMQGGKKGLLENSRNLCKSVSKAAVQMTAQSGKRLDLRPVVKSAGCKKAKQRKQKRR